MPPSPPQEAPLLRQGVNGSGNGAEKPRSPFAFLGAGSGVDKRRGSHERRSSAPVAVAAGVKMAGAVVASGDVEEDDERRPWAGTGAGAGVDAVAFRSAGGNAVAAAGGGTGVGAAMAVSGPEFDVLWSASRGWILEKMMRRIELPSHVSRHRPPLGKEEGQQGKGEGAAAARRRVSRSGSGASLGAGE